MPTVTSSTRRRVGLLAFLGPLLTPPSHGSCGGLTISCHLHHAFHRSSSSRGRRALQPRPRLRLRPVCAPCFPICKTPASLEIPGSAAPRLLSLASPASWSSHGRLLVGVWPPLTSHARHPPRESVSSIIRLPRHGSGRGPRAVLRAEPPVTPASRPGWETSVSWRAGLLRARRRAPSRAVAGGPCDFSAQTPGA